MSEQIILVTGAATGVGRATSEYLAAHGFRVFASMRDPDTRNRGAATELRKHSRIQVIELDVTDPASARSALNQIVEQAGRIDVVINNAATVAYGMIEAFDLDQIRKLYEVNVFGSLNVNQAALPYMREQQGGLLIHVSSGLGRMTLPGMGIYSSSKFALEALSETFRYELFELGIDSVSLQLGVYNSRINDSPIFSSNTGIEGAYGEAGAVGRKLNVNFRDEYTDRDPVEVAREIEALIRTDHGKRPPRVCIGPEAQSAVAINQTTAEAQASLLNMLGMDRLAKIAR